MTGLSTNALHAADDLSRVDDVVPPINTSTTFKYEENPDDLIKASELDENSILEKSVYSRLAHPNSIQVEQLLGSILGGYAVVYNSGLSAIFAALTHFNPTTIAIGLGYHGSHGIANLFTRIKGLKQIGLEDDFDQLKKGDLVCLETPVNPEGTAFDIQEFAAKAHKRGAYLLVDSTFAPPPLQDPFKWGADMVVHSATKYLGGHSDLLAGVLVTKDQKVRLSLTNDRVFLGTNIANLESYLLIRSLRTYELRLLKQSENAERLVKYFVEHKNKFPKLVKIWHSSLQLGPFVKEQLPNGYPPVFAIDVDSEQTAKSLPSKLKYFHHATSLGGVESLIEWRAMSDESIRPTLLRVSVGVENVEDLIRDLENALS